VYCWRQEWRFEGFDEEERRDGRCEMKDGRKRKEERQKKEDERQKAEDRRQKTEMEGSTCFQHEYRELLENDTNHHPPHGDSCF